MLDFAEIITLALRSIRRNKTRSALTMLGIIIGVAAVILLVSLGQGLQNYITNQFEKLGSNIIYVLPGKVSLEGGMSGGAPSFSGSKFTLEMVGDIGHLGGAIEAAGAANEQASTLRYKDKSRYVVVDGITADYIKISNLTVQTGRNISQSDTDAGRKVIVIGKGVADKVFKNINPLGKEVTVGEQKFTVIGVLKDLGSLGGAGGNDNCFISITASQSLFGIDNVQSMSVKAKTKEQIGQAKTQIEKYLSRQMSSDDFTVTDSSSLLTSINQILGVLTAALGGIAAISLVVGGVGIMNIMLVSVTERTREIGLRKAVGAKPKDILLQFMIEAIVLSTLGGFVGILIGFLGAQAINKFFPASVSLWSVSLSFFVSAMVGIVFGVAPAVRASKLNPIDALRYE
jgi:putative ABC transport system permease protein